MYLLNMFDIDRTFLSIPTEAIATMEQLNELREVGISESLKNALDKFINTGEIVGFSCNNLLFKRLTKIKEACCYYDGMHEYIYENMWGCKYRFIFSSYYVNLIYVKEEDGKLYRGFMPVIENLALEISEEHREGFIEEYREVRFSDASTLPNEYVQIKILKKSNKHFSKNHEEIDNKITTTIYHVDRRFKDEEEMAQDYQSPKIADVAEVSFIISLIMDGE